MDEQGQQNGVIYDGRDQSVIIQDVHASDRLLLFGPNALVIGAQAGLLPRFLPARREKIVRPNWRLARYHTVGAIAHYFSSLNSNRAAFSCTQKRAQQCTTEEEYKWSRPTTRTKLHLQI